MKHESSLTPFSLILLPEVPVTTLIFGLTIGWTVLTPVLVSSLCAMPPKLWLPWQIGFLNFGALIGLLIGLPVGGVVAYLLSRRRNEV